MLLALRMLLSIEWPADSSERYYWEHCSWVDRDDWSSDAAMALALINNQKLLYTSQVKFEAARYYFPDSTSVYFEQTYTFPQFGSRPVNENYSILIAARWRLFGFDGSYSYHLHRQPVGADYLDDDRWSALGYVQQQTRMNTYLILGVYRTRTGSLIASGEVGTLPVQWQMRHGTKRRQSRFWLP